MILRVFSLDFPCNVCRIVLSRSSQSTWFPLQVSCDLMLIIRLPLWSSQHKQFILFHNSRGNCLCKSMIFVKGNRSWLMVTVVLSPEIKTIFLIWSFQHEQFILFHNSRRDYPCEFTSFLCDDCESDWNIPYSNNGFDPRDTDHCPNMVILKQMVHIIIPQW
jgi:hypothetical protein